MNPVILILLMMVIGALIGGITNSLAIKMLFRPYQAIYIGKSRLPFTPGLIPKRQKELAKQLGKMVVEHLLTPEGLRRKLERPAFQEQMTTWAQQEAKKMLENPATLQEVVSALDIKITAEGMEKSVSEWIENRYHSVMGDFREEKVRDLLPEEWRQKAENGADQLAWHIQNKMQAYFESHEGKQKVSALIENYLNNQGFLGNMISSFMSAESLTERVHPAIIKYVSDEEMNVWLKGMLQKELQDYMSQPLSFFEDQIGKTTIGHTLGQAVAKSLPLDEWLARSVEEWTKPIQTKLLDDFIPLLVTKMTGMLSSKVESMMKTMHLSEIVQEEVEAFQVERLEDMVLGISKREFKMITYLGALLGSIIGVLQGIIVLFFG